jgi:hypothetical protein
MSVFSYVDFNIRPTPFATRHIETKMALQQRRNKLFSHWHSDMTYKLSLSFKRPMVTLCSTTFNTHKFHVLPTQCIYVFCVDLRTNSDYFPKQHYLTGLYNRHGVFTARYGLDI